MLLTQNQIVFEDCFIGANEKDRCFISVDCTDCPIKEPHPFNEGFFSHKIRAAAYRYEVGISIKQGDIVWVSGPWPAGIPDETIFKSRISKLMGENELAECDSGYRGLEKATTPRVASFSADRKQKSQVRGRHENFNGKFKNFQCLYGKYRNHGPTIHCKLFTCITILTQIGQEHGEKLYDVNYNVEYN